VQRQPRHDPDHSAQCVLVVDGHHIVQLRPRPGGEKRDLLFVQRTHVFRAPHHHRRAAAARLLPREVFPRRQGFVRDGDNFPDTCPPDDGGVVQLLHVRVDRSIGPQDDVASFIASPSPPYILWCCVFPFPLLAEATTRRRNAPLRPRTQSFISKASRPRV